MVNKELLVRYFEDKTTPEESVQVIAYLASDSSDFKLLESIMLNYDDQYPISIDQTDNIKREQHLWLLQQKLYLPMAAVKYPALYSIEQAGTEQDQASENKWDISWMNKKTRRWYIAAAVVMVVLLSARLYSPETEIKLMKAAVTAKNYKGAGILKQISNESDSLQTLKLTDGSVVILYAHAGISYYVPFGKSGNRDISLSGKAFFNIAKDKANPFTVYSGRLSTTALGTSFMIDQKKQSTNVKLYTGKVVIRSIDPAWKGWNKNIFLNPGQQMTCHTDNSKVEVTNMHSKKEEAEVVKKTNRISEQTDALVFDNTPLPEVLGKLAKKFHVSIEYNSEKIADMFFSGTVDQHDKLDVILHVIMQTNELSLEVKSGRYSIQKNK
ncbi:MAG: FecR family protein [Chitinophagaceae bacterium]|nr:FecR family protein [Chitinophagaceae bacterium]MDP1764647.1 FecR family protein [Sediminibacterium sp.]MDP1812320.1 FecR family protein [Sediminibacterium sp.]MDP3128840.1 FecR family protein [Sediminibacterium sp.]MDP3665519.1 FecR family protein [Sediminibacterium sp.]